MANRFFLIIKAPNGDVREVPLTKSGVVLGRDDSADVRVDDKKVSRRHVAFKVMDGAPWVEDLGSANGVRLNGKKVDKKAKLGEDDEVKVGSYQVSVRDVGEGTGSALDDREDVGDRPPTATAQVRPRVIEKGPPKKQEDLPVLIGIDPPTKGRSFILRLGENIVGRLEECDVPILDGSVSRQHARLVYSKDRVTVTDLGSANGVFVNQVRIDMAELADADVLKIGSVSFDVKLPAALAAKGTAPVRTRAKEKKGGPSSHQWLLLGAAGLFLAVFVISGTVYWRFKGRQRPQLHSLFAQASTTDAGGVAEIEPPPPPPTGPQVVPRSLDAGVVPRGLDAGVVPRGLDAGPPPPPPAPPPPPPPPTVATKIGKDAGVGKGPPPTAPPPRLEAPTMAGTATSPYARRGPDGLPIDLPEVDITFDLERFAQDKLKSAAECQQKSDLICLKGTIAELLERDPINQAAKKLLAGVEATEAAEQALVKADRLASRGEFAAALRALAEIAAELPQAATAKIQAEKIHQLAIEDELSQADKESDSKTTWRRAHERYTYVLGLDPDSERALEGLRKVEKKMRGKSMEFSEYRPPGSKNENNPTSPGEILDLLKKHHGDDVGLARVAEIYSKGDLAKAKAAAKAEEKKPGGDKRAIREMGADLDRVQTQYDRTRTEISNDPDTAWAMLGELKRTESRILPDRVRSYLAEELSAKLSDAFAERGTSFFDNQRYEDAFQKWESANKLDPTNPKVKAGMKKLEAIAKTLADSAELATQRGDKTVCDQWKKITRMTPAQSEYHLKARRRVGEVCR